MRDRLCRGQQVAPTLALLRFKCSLVPRKRRRELSARVATLLCKRSRESQRRLLPASACEGSSMNTSLLRLRGRARVGATTLNHA